MRVTTWKQDKFLRPNRYEESRAGDFWSLSGFIPSVDGLSLERMPSWTGHINFFSQFSEPYGAFYQSDADRFCFNGQSSIGDPNPSMGNMTIGQAAHTSLGFYNTGTGATDKWSHLGGNHKQNILSIFGHLWLIGNDGQCYQADDYTFANITSVYSAQNVLSLHLVRDTLYLIDALDDVYRWNPGTSSFDLFFESTMDLNVHHAIHYREKIVMFGCPLDGSLVIYEVDDREPAQIRQLLRVPGETSQFLPDTTSAMWATPWAIHDDRLFFSPGLYWSQDSDAELAPIWRFDGSSIDVVDQVPAPFVPNAWGLLNWRGRLALLKKGSQKLTCSDRCGTLVG